MFLPRTDFALNNHWTRETRENMGLLLNGNGHFITTDMEKTKLLSDFFASLFTGVRFALGKSVRSLKPVGRSGARKRHLYWRRIELGNKETNWTERTETWLDCWSSKVL